ncbi:MAG: DUF493 domain-containing protein [Flavobacteriales bacterium]|nr:DUF493 domain-containing protein [Flavobacteriales bacterium]
MEQKETPEEFYKKFKAKLESTTHFPSIYTYKFIVPTAQTSAVSALFDCTGAVISTKPSAKGTYTSVTVSLMMPSADDVIAKYRQASTIEGVVML